MAHAGAQLHRVKTQDLLVAAPAVQQGVGVLHYDGDYELIADHGGAAFESRWIVDRGSLGAVTPDAGVAAKRKAFRSALLQRVATLPTEPEIDEAWPRLIEVADGLVVAAGLEPLPPVRLPPG